jgi:hypothetical protein
MLAGAGLNCQTRYCLLIKVQWQKNALTLNFYGYPAKVHAPTKGAMCGT